MGKPINIKCQECASYRFPRGTNKPDCFVPVRCDKKRVRYRQLEHYRKIARQTHRYIKWLKEECYLCHSKEDLEGHHVKQQVNGGEDTQDNIMTLCKKCHRIITNYEKAIGTGYKLLS